MGLASRLIVFGAVCCCRGPPDRFADGGKTGAEIGEFLFLPDGPLETFACDRAGDVDKMKAPRLGKAQGLAGLGKLFS
uniref:hypothetical protein n=1 Tax=Rhizobium sp. F40D2 TaxID=3453141 RepID=UPI003F22BA95